MDRAIAKFVLPRDFSAKATIGLILKDLECAMQAAGRLGVEQSLAPVAARMYHDAVAQGHGEKDIAAVVLPLEERSGVVVKGASAALHLAERRGSDS